MAVKHVLVPHEILLTRTVVLSPSEQAMGRVVDTQQRTVRHLSCDVWLVVRPFSMVGCREEAVQASYNTNSSRAGDG